MKRHISTTCRRMASSDKIQNYLDGWVGSSNPSARKAIKPMRKTAATMTSGPPLLLTGSSYLMPTLRIDRRDDSASLQVKIARALKESAASSHKSVAGVKSMLRGKSSRSGGRWKVPIVLDLSALVPDGSPHYVPPQRGLLMGVVETLGEYGISVIGLINTPQELETEAIQQLALPSLLSKGTLSSRSTDFKVRLEDVVQMVFDKASSATTNDNIDSSSLEGEPPIYMEPVQSTDIESSQMPNDPAETLNQPVESKVPDFANSMVYYGSVRSGQQIAADKGQALIIIGSVNSGGEVLSDTDIFIFGKLRGRALAGLASEEAKIVATSFDPELICIGDTFTTVSNVTDFGLKIPGKAAMVSLSPLKELVVEAITL